MVYLWKNCIGNTIQFCSVFGVPYSYVCATLRVQSTYLNNGGELKYRSCDLNNEEL